MDNTKLLHLMLRHEYGKGWTSLEHDTSKARVESSRAS